MQKRICPMCNSVWYSAAISQTWICPKCRAEIKPKSKTLLDTTVVRLPLASDDTRPSKNKDSIK